MPLLSEVFGIRNSVPTYTYVDRARLDQRLQYMLKSDKHIVICAPSKQGKTILRRKCLEDSKSISINCTPSATLDDIYSQILEKLGAKVPVSRNSTTSGGGSGGIEFEAEAALPLFGKGKAKGTLGGKVEGGDDLVVEYVTTDPLAISRVAEELRKSGRRVVLEDFHYLEMKERVRLAYDLKAFLDQGAYFLVIGIWNEPNLLTYYNGDLLGRIDEIDVQWTNEELRTVLRKGQEALNIEFAQRLEDEMVSDAQGNVGLLQDLAEKYCLECGLVQTHESVVRLILSDEGSLQKAREKMCYSMQSRFKNFASAFRRGLKQYEVSDIRSYDKILNVCLEAQDRELIQGIPIDVVQVRTSLRRSDLSAALSKVDRVQFKHGISPTILSYSVSLKTLRLVDQWFLFYRKYSGIDGLKDA